MRPTVKPHNAIGKKSSETFEPHWSRSCFYRAMENKYASLVFVLIGGGRDGPMGNLPLCLWAIEPFAMKPHAIWKCKRDYRSPAVLCKWCPLFFRDSLQLLPYREYRICLMQQQKAQVYCVPPPKLDYTCPSKSKLSADILGWWLVGYWDAELFLPHLPCSCRHATKGIFLFRFLKKPIALLVVLELDHLLRRQCLRGGLLIGLAANASPFPAWDENINSPRGCLCWYRLPHRSWTRNGCQTSLSSDMYMQTVDFWGQITPFKQQ